MSLEAPLVGEAEHLVVHTGGVADAQHIESAVDELFRYPVDGHIALCTHQHLVLAAQRLVDGLHQRGGLASARRPVHNGHILGPQHLVDGVLLGVVQIVETHVGEGEGLCLLARIEEVAQVAQPALGSHGALKGLEHEAIAGLVEEQLHAQPAVADLQVGQRRIVGNGHDHAVAVDKAHGAGEE